MPFGPWPPITKEPAKMANFEYTPCDDADDFVGARELRSVITPQHFLPDRSSDWARLHFAGRKRGFELVVGRMAGIVKGAEERERTSFHKLWRERARSIWLRGLFQMTARLDADELTHALERDPELANAQGWAAERGRCPGLVECSLAACNAILPWAFAQHALRAFDDGAKKLEFDIDVCLQATGKTSPHSSPYRWLIVSWVEDRAYRLRAGRPMAISPRLRC
jgi:hypothetical protein